MESEWRKVTRRGSRQKQRPQGYQYGKTEIARRRQAAQERSNETVSYFFTEIPDNFGAQEMWDVFRKYGRIDEVVIPYKKDKKGRRFGFARFFGVRDPTLFATRLDNIIIGNKIFVNLPRFRHGVWEGKQNTTGPRQQELHQNSRSRPSVRMEGKSYAYVVKNGERNQTLDALNHEDQKGDQRTGERKLRNAGHKPYAHLSFEVEEEIVQKLNKAFVGQVSRPRITYSIQDEFHKEGYFTIKATPLGANRVLLEAEDEGEIPALINDASEWLLNWFDEIRPWSPREIDNERLVWVRCYGVPAHAWSIKFFSFIVSTIGEFVDVDDNTRNRESMDMARILFKTRVHDLVCSITKVNIGGDVFSIKLVEEWYGPMTWSLSSKNVNNRKYIVSSEDETVEDDTNIVEEDDEGRFSDDDLNLNLNWDNNDTLLLSSNSETKAAGGDVNELAFEHVHETPEYVGSHGETCHNDLAVGCLCHNTSVEHVNEIQEMEGDASGRNSLQVVGRDFEERINNVVKSDGGNNGPLTNGPSIMLGEKMCGPHDDVRLEGEENLNGSKGSNTDKESVDSGAQLVPTQSTAGLNTSGPLVED